MRRALLVGIDHYPTGKSLGGCVADANALGALLARNADNSPNFKTEIITGSADAEASVTRYALRSALARFFKDSRDTDLLFYFAGYGGQTVWGAELVTQDAQEYDLGVCMNDLVTLANDSPARSITLILDCCFSGDAGSVPGLQSTAVTEPFRLSRALLRENLTILTASRSSEISEEYEGHGAFTRVLLDGLAGGASDQLGRITPLSLYTFISAAFDAFQQRPLFKANLAEPTLLRIGPPWLDVALLRQLPYHFPDTTARIQLSPAHEGEGRPLPSIQAGTAEQQQFDYLIRLRNAHLVTTDGSRDHYWVALESGYVYLTPLGEYFRNLAIRGEL